MNKSFATPVGGLSPACIDYDYPDNLKGWRGMALVGEAPGAEEVELGRPFVGRSGQLLDTLLAKVGIDRRACLVANVFRYRPPDNKVDHFFVSRRKAQANSIQLADKYGKFGSIWCRAEFAGELEYLRSTLQKLNPAVIVSLGRTPLWALTGQDGLLSKVGVPVESTLVPDVPVIPTYHPSFILRGNWRLQDDWARHFVFAKQHVV